MEADVLTSFKYMMFLFKDVDGEHTPCFMPSDHKQTHLESFIFQLMKEDNAGRVLDSLESAWAYHKKKTKQSFQEGHL